MQTRVIVDAMWSEINFSQSEALSELDRSTASGELRVVPYTGKILRSSLPKTVDNARENLNFRWPEHSLRVAVWAEGLGWAGSSWRTR